MTDRDDDPHIRSNELLVTLETTNRATNLTLSENELHVVSVDTSARSWTSVLLCQAPQPAIKQFSYLHILNAQVLQAGKELVVEIRAVELKGHEGVAVIRGKVDNEHAGQAERWVKQLLENAYGNVKREKHLRVLINPAAGAGKAQAMWIKQVEPIFRSAGCTLDVTFTKQIGHANEIAHDLDTSLYDAVVTFSGDGLVYEVVNAFCSRKDALQAFRDCPIGVLPAGSGNAMAVSLNGPKLGLHLGMAALTILKGKPLDFDICSITQQDKRFFSFLSQAYGLMADVDLGTEHMRWMGGNRFIVGFIQRAFAGPHYECEISMRIVASDKSAMKQSIIEGSSKRPDSHVTEASGALPPLRFGTVNDPIPSGPDLEFIKDSKATGWTTVNAPVCTMYAGTVPYLADNLLQFPIANSDGNIVVSILPVVSTSTLLGAMDGSEVGKHYDVKEMEYYKVEAYRLSPKPNKSRFPNFISIDGEYAAFEPFQVEAHPGIGKVLSLRDGWYLPPNWTKERLR